MHMVLVSKLSIQVIKTGQSRSTLIPTIRRGNPNNFMTKPSRPVCSIVLQSMPQLDPVIALSPNFQSRFKTEKPANANHKFKHELHARYCEINFR
ncbi:hypothetical protein MJO29_009044 [Puccinia striiformis f. sp. tritici]|nr:hypothetical protein MJO29_009044 [Puccinia striiformis f. sp. tritici]